MSKKLFISAVAAGILAFGMNAMAASPNTGQLVTMQATSHPTSVELQFDGAQHVTFRDAGTLEITRADGTTMRYRPNLSQEVNGKRKYLLFGFRILGKDRVALTMSNADRNAPVALDGIRPTS